MSWTVRLGSSSSGQKSEAGEMERMRLGGEGLGLVGQPTNFNRSDLDEAVAELRREVERLRSRVATQEAQLKQGDRVLQMRDAKVSALEGRVQELSAATRPTTSSEEEAVATSARERCETLTKELEVKDRLIKALQADRKEKKELQDRCEAMSKELEEKEARLKALQADRKEKKELQARCETVSKELEEKETRIKTLQVHVAHVDRPRSL